MISLAIPTWDRSGLTIESFQQVVDNPFVGEIVIVDDFSDSEIFVNLWNNLDCFHSDKIKLHRNNSNIGPLANKYEVVKKCENDWIILLDSDNIIGNDYIEVIEKLDKKKDTLYMPETLFGMDKKEIKWAYKEVTGRIIDRHNVKNYLEVGDFSTCLNTGNYFFNKNTYLQVHKSHKKNEKLIVNDAIYFSYLWLISGFKMMVVPNLGYIHRVHGGSWYKHHSADCGLVSEEIEKRIRKLT